MKSLSVRTLSVLACASGLLAIAPALHAATVTGSYYQTGLLYDVPASGSAVYGSPNATFTVTTPGPGIDLASSSNGNAANYTLAGFLGTGGSVVFNSGAAYGGDPLDTVGPNGTGSTTCGGGNHPVCGTNSLFQFKGSATVVAGEQIQITHDDGVLLYLNGVLVINSADPTTSALSSYTVTTGGTDSYELDYAEVEGAPAVLDVTGISLRGAPIPVPTPEPGSFVLLGSGLLAAAGMIRRRMTA